MEEFGKVLSEEEASSLFDDDLTGAQSEEGDPNEGKQNKENVDNKDAIKAAEADDGSLFDDAEIQPESVGSEEENQAKEDSKVHKDDGTSDTNFFSSIAKTLNDEGVLQLDDSSKVTTADALKKAFEDHITNRLDETQKRINNALNVGMKPDEIQQYEEALKTYNGISESDLVAETKEAGTLRANLIMQDFLNKGFDRDDATEMTKRSIKGGTDIEDAKKALASGKEFFDKKYSSQIEENTRKQKEFEKEREKQAAALKKSMLEGKDFMESVSVSKELRQKAYDAVSKPIWKDPDTGNVLTEVQKYQKEHPNDFIQNIGLLYTLTDGYKNIDKLVSNKVKKERKNTFNELETTLNSSKRYSDGTLNFVGDREDGDSHFVLGKGIALDL